MPGMSEDDVTAIFTFHPPVNEDAAELHQSIREFHLELAQIMRDALPVCPEQTLAIRALQQSMMYSNAAVAVHGTAVSARAGVSVLRQYYTNR